MHIHIVLQALVNKHYTKITREYPHTDNVSTTMRHLQVKRFPEETITPIQPIKYFFLHNTATAGQCSLSLILTVSERCTIGLLSGHCRRSQFKSDPPCDQFTSMFAWKFNSTSPAHSPTLVALYGICCMHVHTHMKKSASYPYASTLPDKKKPTNSSTKNQGLSPLKSTIGVQHWCS